MNSKNPIVVFYKSINFLIVRLWYRVEDRCPDITADNPDFPLNMKYKHYIDVDVFFKRYSFVFRSGSDNHFYVSSRFRIKERIAQYFADWYYWAKHKVLKY